MNHSLIGCAKVPVLHKHEELLIDAEESRLLAELVLPAEQLGARIWQLFAVNEED